jgi:branched-chain amino acid transport system permease protein
LRHSPRLMQLITAIGASFFWQYYFRGLFGSQVRPFPDVAALNGTVPFLETQVLRTHVLVHLVTVVALIALNYFINKTKSGLAIRAVAENKDVAALMGINVDRTISLTFATGAAMAGIAGLLYALVYHQVHFFMGFFPGLKAFTAAVLGGIGNIPGAAVGGLLLGLVESVGPSLFLQGLGIPAFNQLKDVIAFTMLVLVLIFRPQGIMGERLAEKKA